MLIPSSLYKLPSCYTSDVLLTESVIYIHQPPTTQFTSSMSMSTSVIVEHQEDVTNYPVTNSSQETDDSSNNANKINTETTYDENAIKIISCNLASAKIGEECDFNERALLGTFKFPLDEKILNVFPMLTIESEINNDSDGKDSGNSHDVEMKSTYSKYLSYHSKSKSGSGKFDEVYDSKVLKNAFPFVNFEKVIFFINLILLDN